ERLRDDHVLQNVRTIAEHLTRRGQAHLEVAGGREHGGLVDPVVGQVAVSADADLALELRGIEQRRAHPLTEERVHARPAPHHLPLRDVDPVALALEGVGGQLHAPPPVRPVHSRPVHLHSPHVQLRHTPEQRLPLPSTRPQRRQPHTPGHLLLRHAALAEHHQRGTRPHLHEHPLPPRPQRLHPVRVPHRLPQLPRPVARLPQHLTSHHLSRHVRHHPDPRLPIPHPARHPLELPHHRIHQRRVERVRHPQPLHSHSPTHQLAHHPLHRLLSTRHHHALRRVHRRNRHLSPAHSLHHLPHPLLRRKHRHHHPTRPQAPHQPPAPSHQPHRLLPLQHPRHARRHVLPNTVPQHQRRLRSPRAPQLHQRPHQRKQRRLRVLRP